MNRFHDNLDVVKTTSIKVEHLYCESLFRSINFVIECNVASRFFKGKPRRLRLPWTIGNNVTIAWFGGTAPFGWSAPSPLGQNVIQGCQSEFPQKRERLPYINWTVQVSGNCSNDIPSWTRLVRVTAYVLRFIENSKRKRISQSGKELPINVSDLREVAQFCCSASFRKLTSERSGTPWAITSRFGNPVL
jgi:hypothetical protein